MATTLSYGFKKPANGDKGSSFFPNLEDDIQQLNDHTHNGTNSSLLSPAATAAGSVTVEVVNWSAGDNPDDYSATVNAPSGITEVNNVNIYCIQDGERVELGITRLSATSISINGSSAVETVVKFR